MSDIDLGKRALAAMNWSYGGAIARVLAQTLVQLLLARFLGPEAFGQATAAFFVLALGWLLAECGFGSALVQKADLRAEDIAYALGWVLLLSCCAGAIVIAASWWLATGLGDQALVPLIIASGALIPIQAVSNIPSSLMRRNLDMRRAQFIYMGGYLFAYGLFGLPLAWAGAGAWSLVVAFGLHSLLNLVGSYLVVRHSLRPRLRGDKALRRFGLQVTGTNAANWAIENADRLLVNRYWGAAALGEYTAAFTLSRAPANLLVSSIQSVTFASASLLQHAPARLARAYLALLALVTLITCPLFTLLAMHAGTVVHLVYGHRWSNTGPLFAAFCVGLPFYAVLSITGPFLWALNAVRHELVIQLASAAITLIGFIALAGTPLASAVWLIPAMSALRMGWVYRALAIHLKFGHWPAACAVSRGLVLCLPVALVCRLAIEELSPLPALLVSSLGALLMCGGAVCLWPMVMLPPELRALLQNRAGSSAFIAAVCRFVRLERHSI